MVCGVKKYAEILKSHQLKVTPQRLQIMKYLDEHRSHPPVETIYTELKKANPSLSKTTVYNALETLQHHRIINSITISGSEQRYDYKTTSHHHFLCKQCGIIADFDIECPYSKKTTFGEYQIDEVHGYFKGICKTCKGKLKEKKH